MLPVSVDAEDALEAGPEGGHGQPVAMQQVATVLQPVWEHVLWDDPPAPLPDLIYKLLLLLHGMVGLQGPTPPPPPPEALGRPAPLQLWLGC